MEFPYIKEGKICDVNGRIIEKPSILIVKDEFVGYGTYGYLEYKSKLECRKLVLSGKSVSAVSLIPLFEKVDINTCLNIIKICIIGEDFFAGSNNSYSDFIKDLCKLKNSKKCKF